MPWDDDIDIIIDSNDVNKLFKGLKLRNETDTQKEYYINKDIIIISNLPIDRGSIRRGTIIGFVILTTN